MCIMCAVLVAFSVHKCMCMFVRCVHKYIYFAPNVPKVWGLQTQPQHSLTNTSHLASARSYKRIQSRLLDRQFCSMDNEALLKDVHPLARLSFIEAAPLQRNSKTLFHNPYEQSYCCFCLF